MNNHFSRECDSKRIQSVSIYKAKLKTGRFRLYNLLFLIAYVIQAGWVLSTIGQPYHRFLLKAQTEGFQVMEGQTRFKAELQHQLKDLNDPNRRTQKLSWTAWMDYDVEQLVQEKKKDKQKNVLDSLPKHMRVPPKYATDFWPSLVLGMLATIHALVILLQHWSVSFRIWINYQPVNVDEDPMVQTIVHDAIHQDVDLNDEHPERALTNHRYQQHNTPTHARIVPSQKGEPHLLIPIEYFPILGMTFQFHRRTYVYDPEQQIWCKIRCRTDLELELFQQWKGLDSELRVVTGKIRYGSNTFSVKQPNFMDLYKKQLLNPFSVFQIFCVLLWAIDDYLIYSFFSLFMVLMFEGTVVFQRIRSMQALRGMGNPSRPIYVLRTNWTQVDSTELLPGDVMSLTRIKPHHEKTKDGKVRSMKVEDEGGDIVPADLLLLRGTTVVNEASLTGESVPQMKEGLSDLEPGQHLSIKDKHKMNVCYAGTKMLQCKGATDYLNGEKVFGNIPPPPDGGCVCFVLRTGFASAQGKLVRMIEGSQEKVKGHERETGLLLLLLCVFAVISSGYVLYHGAQNENRSKYELLLHCILIVTSVIRPELPMQMALAVNNSLMTLMKLHIFCTEPYRVPTAGKLDTCLFDKTGTLTTDELVAVGICTPPKLKVANGKEEEDPEFLTKMMKANFEAALVLCGCHSLVVVDEETTGDPLESASIKSMHWCVDTKSGMTVPSLGSDKKAAGKPINLSSGHVVSEVEILTRHHFSSKLQRMSCVVKASGRSYSVAKGSAEAIGNLLQTKPANYDEKAEYLSKEGFRVISLAFKPLETSHEVDAAQEHRSACEEDLIFAGFIAFTCKVRKDTSSVLARLKEGGMGIAMVTGDALLTAIHVAKEVEICEPIKGAMKPSLQETNEELQRLLASKRGESRKAAKKTQRVYNPIAYLETSEKGKLYWKSYEDGHKVADYSAMEVPLLAKTTDLAVSGKHLSAAFEEDQDTKKILQYIKVFARMSPDQKETVIESLHSVNQLCLMCGDGANDVGALKQADVGVALLSGFGNINVDQDDEEKPKETDTGATAMISKEHLDQIRSMPVRLIKMKIRSLGVDPDKYPELVEKEDLVRLYQIKAREIAVKRHDQKNAQDRSKMTKAELAAERKRLMEEKQRKMYERVKELEAQGETWAQWKAMKEFYNQEMEDAKQKKAGMTSSRGVEGSAATLASQFEGLETGELPMIKLGDASIAAPFTSKMPSIQSCVDVVRQGRCTLVSSMQMVRAARV